MWFGESIRDCINSDLFQKLGDDAAHTQEKIQAIKQRINRTDIIG